LPAALSDLLSAGFVDHGANHASAICVSVSLSVRARRWKQRCSSRSTASDSKVRPYTFIPRKILMETNAADAPLAEESKTIATRR
jgi:hypothetical protein